MKKLALAFLLCVAAAWPAAAQEYYDIDVDLPAYPEMQPIPESPVYYAPGVDSNYFFYDGLYWDFNNDGWYASPWYNGPWQYVDPVYVPTYILWVPIHYYRRPPHYFHAWQGHRAPHWGERWGRDWQRRHNEIYRGTTNAATRAPLPQYQRQFTRANYPRAPQQQSAIHGQNYLYQPREQVARQAYQARGIAPQVRQQPSHGPAGQQHGGSPEARNNPAAR